MNDIKKLSGPLNPKLAKKIARYLVEDKFSYEDVCNMSIEFSTIHEKFLYFLETKISECSLQEVLNEFGINMNQKDHKDLVKCVDNIETAENLFDFFVQSYKAKKYGKKTVVLLKLIMNNWLYKNGYSLLIFYPSLIKELDMLVENDGDFSVMKQLLLYFYNDSFVRNTVVNVKSQQEMIKQIKKVKETLVLQYGIKKLWMFGSYAKNTQTAFSDLDLFIEAMDKVENDEIEAMNDYLSAMLGLKVNIAITADFIHYEMIEII